MQIKGLSQTIIVVYSLGAALALAYLFNAGKQISNLNRLWERHEISEEKNDHLVQLQMQAGYGGLIHHFKNYLIRRDTHYYDQAMASYRQLQQTLESFHQLPLTTEEQQELETIERTISTYYNRLNAAYNLVDEQFSTQEVDARVRVDDTAALAALASMNRRINDQYHGNAKAFGVYLDENRQALLIALPIVLLVLVGFSAFCVWFLYHRVMRPLAQLTDTLKHTHSLDENLPMPHRTRRDEIGVIANAIEDFKEELRANEQVKSRFLATMSHEIRTPIHGVLGMAELILSAKPSAKIRTHAQTILNSGESLLTIVNDILDFSKLEAGKIRLHPASLQLRELIDDLTALHAAKAREKGIELVAHYTPDTPQHVMADATRLRQVIGNLIANAVKFTDQGYVAIEVQSVAKPNLAPNEVGLQITITDTGIGIHPKKLPHVFDLFTQAHRESDGKYGGTGLGLAICHELIAQMGGCLRAESTPGKGSRFIVELSFPRGATSPISHSYPALEHTRMLVVDDLAFFRQLVVEQASFANIRCDVANSASEALRMLRTAYKLGDPYQIALVDYHMPDMNGSMLADAIQCHTELAATCLIMLTATGLPINHESYKNHGFAGYISKPIDHARFLSSIEAIWHEYKGTAPAHTPYAPQFTELTSPVAGARILVAEDNLVNQVFLEEILKEMACEYTLTTNGQAAVEAAERASYDLVLMDCLMPIMDGYEATRRLCALKAQGRFNAATPIIALTANAANEGQAQCLQAGMDGFIAKPIRKKPLKEAIQQWLTHQDNHPRPTPSETGNINVSSPPLLDEALVNEARNILHDKYSALIPTYLDKSWQQIKEIRSGLQEDDWQLIIRTAHTLKASSIQMGAAALGALAHALEQDAKDAAQRQQSPSAVANHLLSKLDEMERTLAQTQPLIRQLAA